MASNDSPVTPEDVIAAVMNDPTVRDVDPDDLEVYKTFAALLPEVVGPDRLDTVLTARVFLSVCADFLNAAAAVKLNDDGEISMLQDLYLLAAEQFELILEDFDGFLARAGLAEDELMKAPLLKLNPDLMVLALAGTLTMRHILLGQPLALIPMPAEE